ncbi:MAG: class I SAM-dependent methyltransferase [Candidatus Aenigmatarchaeota archaeon]
MIGKIKKFYSENPEEYDAERNTENVPENFLRQRERFISMVSGERILDAGCGTGKDTDYFVDRGMDAIGVDISHGMISYAREHKKGRFQVMDIRNLGFQDGSFHGVWCCASIFFMPKEGVMNALDEMNRILKPNGVIYVSFKIGDGNTTRKRNGQKIKEYLFREKDIKEMLENASFKIVESDTNKGGKTGETFGTYTCEKTGNLS